MDWEHIADGIDVVRYWKTVAPEAGESEVAILKLSIAQFSRLQQNPKAFINDNKIFDRPVASMELRGAATNVPQLVIVAHRPTCPAVGSAVPDLAQIPTKIGTAA